MEAGGGWQSPSQRTGRRSRCVFDLPQACRLSSPSRHRLAPPRGTTAAARPSTSHALDPSLTHAHPTHSRRPRPLSLPCAAASSSSNNRTRLATRLITLPRRVDLYFEGQPVRRLLWTAIAFALGFYAANTVSLSFGALSVNDVVAAALTVAFYEGVSAVYHRAARKTLRLLFLNSFKVGVVVALIADAFKLAG